MATQTLDSRDNTKDSQRRPTPSTLPSGDTAPGPAASAPASPDTPADVSAHRWWIMLGLIMAAALEILDTTVVNVALPQMSGNLGATTDEIAWVSTGYILANVIVLPMTAWLSGRFGRKRYLMASLIIFNVAYAGIYQQGPSVRFTTPLLRSPLQDLTSIRLGPAMHCLMAFHGMLQELQLMQEEAQELQKAFEERGLELLSLNQSVLTLTNRLQVRRHCHTFWDASANTHISFLNRCLKGCWTLLHPGLQRQQGAKLQSMRHTWED